jgi:integrase
VGRAGRGCGDVAGARGGVCGGEVAACGGAYPGGIADALATVTPALTAAGGGGGPAAGVLRAALYRHAFSPGRAGGDAGLAEAGALAWAREHSLPLAALADPRVARRALEALALRLDGTGAAATTITRKRAVFRGCLGYAVELGLLAANPAGSTAARPDAVSCAAGPRPTAAPAQVEAVLAEVTRIRPELTAFFGCLYYAALRPAEAVALRAVACDLPAAGWGRLTLTSSLPRSARAWTGNGTPREPRGLKLRPYGAARVVPVPPELVGLLRAHLRAYGCAGDGRLFEGARGGPLSESLYGRVWHQASAAAGPPGTLLVRRPYDLRHAALSLWLASGAPPAEVAARAGHSVRVLLGIYAHPVPGHDVIASQQIERALHGRPGGPRLARRCPRQTGGSCPSGVRVTAGRCGTPWDRQPAAGAGEPATDLREHELQRLVSRAAAAHGRPVRTSLAQDADLGRSGPQLAHGDRERSAGSPPDTPQARLLAVPAPL